MSGALEVLTCQFMKCLWYQGPVKKNATTEVLSISLQSQNRHIFSQTHNYLQQVVNSWLNWQPPSWILIEIVIRRKKCTAWVCFYHSAFGRCNEPHAVHIAVVVCRIVRWHYCIIGVVDNGWTIRGVACHTRCVICSNIHIYIPAGYPKLLHFHGRPNAMVLSQCYGT